MGRRTSNLVTQADYARSRKARGLPGGSRKAVHAAVSDGSIDAFGPDKLIDPELADRQWAQNRRARVTTQTAAAAPGGDLLPAEQSAGAAATDPGPGAAPAAPPPPAADTGYSAARARREKAEADLAEMNARKMRGELVGWEDVARGGFEVGRELRDTLESSVNGLAAELAAIGNAEQCAEILRRHNRAVCDVLVKAWREKVGPVPAGGLAA